MASVIAVEGLTEKLAVGDMVVVPCNTVNPDGTLSPRLKARLDAAFVLFKDGNCAIIFVSGGTGKEGVDEAVAMKTYLVSLGVPAEDIIQDSLGVNTQATAQHAAAVLNRRNLTTVIATSQFFHITRLRMLLERSGVDVVGTTYARFLSYATCIHCCARLQLFLCSGCKWVLVDGATDQTIRCIQNK